MESERRRQKRRKFTYYMRVLDANTLQTIGHLRDISATGIGLDSEKPLPIDRNYQLRLDLTAEMANKTYMVINGRSKWCQADRLEPNSYNVGFEVNIVSRDDSEIFQRMYEKYGSDSRW